MLRPGPCRPPWADPSVPASSGRPLHVSPPSPTPRTWRVCVARANAACVCPDEQVDRRPCLADHVPQAVRVQLDLDLPVALVDGHGHLGQVGTRADQLQEVPAGLHLQDLRLVVAPATVQLGVRTHVPSPPQVLEQLALLFERLVRQAVGRHVPKVVQVEGLLFLPLLVVNGDALLLLLLGVRSHPLWWWRCDESECLVRIGGHFRDAVQKIRVQFLLFFFLSF